MKTLHEFINESILDGEANWEKIDNIAEFKKTYKTLRDCLDGYVTGSLNMTLGPTHNVISKYGKLIKKKFKSDPILTWNGKKCNPSVLSDIIASISEQVIIDWDLPAEARLTQAFKDFNDIYKSIKFPELEQYTDISKKDMNDYIDGDLAIEESYNIWTSIGQDVTKYYSKNGNKSFRTKSGMIGKITISYGTKAKYEKVNNEWKLVRYGGNMGTFEMTIKDNSPITADLDNF